MDYTINFAKPKYMQEFNEQNGYHFQNGESLSSRSAEDIKFIIAAARLFNHTTGNPFAVKVE